MNVLLYKTFDTHTAGGCVNALSDSVGDARLRKANAISFPTFNAKNCFSGS
ncbi:MAG: hypothetical protein V8R49_03695 [Duodenibacillus massiliensis]